MPIYMDRHVVPGILAKHAAEAHREDIKIQDDYGCRCMTYWVDEERGNAFCLIDAPNIEAVQKMHNRAHGLIPHDIMEVNSNVVEAFLGRIQDPAGYFDDDPNLKIFNDPAFRIILVTSITNKGLLYAKLGKEKTDRLIAIYHELFRKELKHFEGREVEKKGHGFVASFVSVTQAVECAVAIRKGLHIAGELLDLRLGLNAGMPVSKSPDLFGDTVKMARYLLHLGKENQIVMASIIREIYKDDGTLTAGRDSAFEHIHPKDENFIQLLFDTLSAHLGDPDLDITRCCEEMSMSKSKLYRKSTDLTGYSVNELLRELRLERSLELLLTERNISQTTFDSGFTSPSYFTKCFQERFGLRPQEYIRLFQ